MRSVGIDFGSEYSSVGVYKNGHAEIIADSQGHRRIPNIITYARGGEILVGHEASSSHSRFPKSSITHVRDILGKSFADIDCSKWMVKIEEKDGDVVFNVQARNNQDPIYVTPVEAVAKIFTQLKTTADSYTSSTVELCTIAVPSDFSDAAKDQVREAATIAGFSTIVFVKDAVCCALAYNLDHNTSFLNPSIEAVESQLVLVIDFGKNLDITVLKVENGFFFVLDNINPDTIMGSDIDKEIMDMVANDFKRKNGLDINENPRAVIKLSKHIEEAKRILSNRNETKINIEALCEGIDYQSNLSISKFEGVTEPVFQKAIGPLKELFEKIDVSDFHSVILAGGNCNIPRIKTLITNFFSNETSSEINPFELITAGASIHAYNLLNREVSDAPVNRTAKDIGLETSEGFIPIIKAHSLLPLKITRDFGVADEYQDTILLKFSEGDSKDSDENNLLGQFSLKVPEASDTDLGRIRITFILSVEGKLTLQVGSALSSEFEKITLEE